MRRRGFVSLLGRLSALLAGSRLLWRPGAAAAASLDDSRRAWLRAAVDEIIPAEGPLPSAAGAGALAHFERRGSQDAAFGKTLRSMLDALDRLCRKASGVGFGDAGREQRIGALRELEKSEPARFAELRDGTYEAYYTNPEVWRLIGHDFRSGAAPTAPLLEFDESSLRRVRGLSPLYRTPPR